MDLLLILTYTAICIVVFKVFKIPLTKWTVPTAVLGGIFLIGALILLMNYNHPYSEVSREYFVTTPIVPNVSGEVIDVPVQPNHPLRAGDVLFQIDPRPFEYKIAALTARLQSAEADFQRATDLLKRNAGTRRDVDLAQAQLDSLQAELDEANYHLEQTTVRAPADGFVTQLILRPGIRAVSIPLRPAMVFVTREERFLVAWFRQNSLLRLEAGNPAEVAFDGIPGTVFSGVVEQVLPVMAEGQLDPSGKLLSESIPTSIPGRVPVVIRLTDERMSAYAGQIPGGAYGQAAVYSHHFHHVAIMRKILLRMASWMNYLFPFH